MIKVTLIALFVMAMATLTVAASSVPVPPHVVTNLDRADLG